MRLSQAVQGGESVCCDIEENIEDRLSQVCRMGVLSELADRYIAYCEENKRLPNLAGFCRHAELGGSAVERLRREFPESYAELCLILEDEALNADIPASVLTAYLKKRLGYDDRDAEPTPCEVGQLKLIFEHDILEDGE